MEEQISLDQSCGNKDVHRVISELPISPVGMGITVKNSELLHVFCTALEGIVGNCSFILILCSAIVFSVNKRRHFGSIFIFHSNG